MHNMNGERLGMTGGQAAIGTLEPRLAIESGLPAPAGHGAVEVYTGTVPAAELAVVGTPQATESVAQAPGAPLEIADVAAVHDAAVAPEGAPDPTRLNTSPRYQVYESAYAAVLGQNGFETAADAPETVRQAAVEAGNMAVQAFDNGEPLWSPIDLSPASPTPQQPNYAGRGTVYRSGNANGEGVGVMTQESFETREALSQEEKRARKTGDWEEYDRLVRERVDHMPDRAPRQVDEQLTPPVATLEQAEVPSQPGWLERRVTGAWNWVRRNSETADRISADVEALANTPQAEVEGALANLLNGIGQLDEVQRLRQRVQAEADRVGNEIAGTAQNVIEEVTSYARDRVERLRRTREVLVGAWATSRAILSGTAEQPPAAAQTAPRAIEGAFVENPTEAPA